MKEAKVVTTGHSMNKSPSLDVKVNAEGQMSSAYRKLTAAGGAKHIQENAMPAQKL